MKLFAEPDDKVRLDVYLADETEYTRSYIKQLIDRGNVLLNGECPKAGTIVKKGDEIDVDPPEPFVAAEPDPTIPVDIIYEDGDIAVINKPQGLTVHPAPGNRSGTLVNALLARLGSLSAINGALRPGIVHRLDKNTSGVMVVAKNDKTHLSLSRQIADRTVTKKYLAIVDGHLKEDSGRIDAPIGRNPRDRKLMAVVPDGRRAITDYRRLETLAGHDLAEFHILTGRTHQIRVHAKYIGHPVTGDAEYGRGAVYGTCGQLLHSYSLTFAHPTTGEEMTFTASPPAIFEKVLRILRAKDGNDV
ncbi:MAG TPA: RluA family pseudouridine synthase [Candidatus Protoclostridium stercorigallinarum]|uniref:Pseudouridine synthase n=1 Tax=Candidatus Protoclostridium stercorigallinarum TaxID=2838741 RepID=A0A9D1PZA9_9FIRM|nr:RluA family pseudouridine synthase [Candidatus Protoclostridium stercorigallinarum]